VRAGRDACRLASDRGAAQTVETAARPDHRVHPIAACMAFLGQVAEGASAVQDADRSDAILWMRREGVRDCQWASDRDFLTAMAVTECLFLLARQGDVRERNPALKPRVALRKVACHQVWLTLSALWFESVQPAALLRALQAQTGESESVQALREQLLQAQSSPAQQALQIAVPPLVAQEPAP
jgi:hypothetical protein